MKLTDMEVKYINKVSTSYPIPYHPIPIVLPCITLFNAMLSYPLLLYSILSNNIRHISCHSILYHLISSHPSHCILSRPFPSLHIPSHSILHIPFNHIPYDPIPLILSNSISLILGRHGEGPRDRNTGPPSSRGREIPHYDVRDTEPPSALSIAERSEA